MAELNSPDSNSEFLLETAKLFNEKLRLAFWLVGLPVISIYFLLDYLTDTALFQKLYPARILALLVFYGLIIFLKRSDPNKGARYSAAYLGSSAVILMNIYVVAALGSAGLANHLAGYIELLLGSVLFISWPSVRAMSGMFFFVSIPLMVVRPFYDFPLTINEIQFHCGILFTIYLVSVHQTRLNNSVRWQEFMARKALEKSNQERSRQVEQKVSEIRTKDAELSQTKIEAETMRKVSEVTFRVAHDIRSPLTALNLATSTISEENSAQKQLILGAVKRISDIALGLLDEKRRIRSHSQNEFQVSVSVEKIVSEKRLIHGAELNALNFEITPEAITASVACERTRFEATLSNLIENAVEASAVGSEVSVSMVREGQFVSVTVTDHGAGIPPELLEKLGKQSVSTKGKGGSGIGLSSAFEFAKSCGGKLVIHSKSGSGTTVNLSLPCLDGPKWLAGGVFLKQAQSIYVVDDDKSVHSVWLSRIPDSARVKTFISPEEIVSGNDSQVFLVDYHFSNSPQNGLDCLKSLPPSTLRYLVTSEHDRIELARECEINGIKIIPKSLIPFIPII